jgi:hypothetical protein
MSFEDGDMKWPSVLLFIAAQAAILILIGRFIGERYISREAQFALVLVFAVVFLMTTLFIVASGFSQLKLTDPSQALGLPVGSVRAMIALILILIFIMFGTYLYNQELSWSNKYGPIEMPQDAWLNMSNVDEVQPIPYTDPARYNVYFVRDDPRDSSQLAQQLLTTVGTLVVAVAGFYFGSASTASSVILGRNGSSAKPPGNGDESISRN